MQCNCSCLGLFAGKEPIIIIKQEIKEQTRKETFKRVVWLGEKCLWHHHSEKDFQEKDVIQVRCFLSLLFNFYYP